MFNIGDSIKRNVLVSCDHGLFVVNRFDHTHTGISGFLLDHGNNNTVEADITIQSLKDIENPVIFDIGANIGTYTSWVANWSANKNGTVYSFEPQRIIFQMLCANMSINNIFNVHTYEMGLGSKKEKIKINEADYSLLGSFGSFSLNKQNTPEYKKTDKQQTIKIDTLDNFVKEHDIQKVDFIKIDAEGMDLDIIEGGILTIKKYKPKLLVEYLNAGKSKDEKTSTEGFGIVDTKLRDLGYKIKKVGHDIFAY
jgi:FkbM family methyltransferase